MNIDLAPFSELIAALPPPMNQEVRSGLGLLRLKLAQLTVETASAEAEEILFSQAVHRPSEYPLMAKLHHGLEAFLVFELTAEQASQMRTVVRAIGGAPGVVGDARVALFDFARSSTSPWSSVARFVAYEAARLNLLLATWDEPAVAATGLLQDFDLEAEQVLKEQLETVPDDVRPLELLISELMVRLNTACEERLSELASAVADVRDDIERRTELVARAREYSPPKNVVIRNTMQSDENRMASAQLVGLFPELFTSEAQVDQTRHRLKDAKPSLHTRILDVLREEG